jgi:hypothetical protein
MKNFKCSCGKEYSNSNIFGKYCVYCNTYTPPEKEMSIVKKNRIKREKLELQLFDYLDNFWRKNASIAKRHES